MGIFLTVYTDKDKKKLKASVSLNQIDMLEGFAFPKQNLLQVVLPLCNIVWKMLYLLNNPSQHIHLTIFGFLP
jgi:hypothetical protein